MFINNLNSIKFYQARDPSVFLVQNKIRKFIERFNALKNE
jgi:hypothetical protein